MLPSRSSQSRGLSSLCRTAASHQPSVLYMVMHMFKCYCQFIPPSPFPAVSISLLSTSASLFPALQIGSSVFKGRWFFFFFFWLHHAAFGILAARPGIKPEPVCSAVEAQSPNHWAARGVPCQLLNELKLRPLLFTCRHFAHLFTHILGLLYLPILRVIPPWNMTHTSPNFSRVNEQFSVMVGFFFFSWNLIHCPMYSSCKLG